MSAPVLVFPSAMLDFAVAGGMATQFSIGIIRRNWMDNESDGYDVVITRFDEGFLEDCDAIGAMSGWRLAGDSARGLPYLLRYRTSTHPTILIRD